MTVRELINRLNNEDPDMLVLVDGYESGYDEINSINIENVSGPKKTDWWDGEYDKCKENDLLNFRALIISR